MDVFYEVWTPHWRIIGIDLTSDLYNIEKISWFAVPTVLLIIPKTLLALLIVIPPSLFDDKSLDNSNSEVLDASHTFQRLSSKSVIWGGVVAGVRYFCEFAFVRVKSHLPSRSPATKRMKVWLQSGCVSYEVFYLSVDFCVVRKYQRNFIFDAARAVVNNV